MSRQVTGSDSNIGGSLSAPTDVTIETPTSFATANKSAGCLYFSPAESSNLDNVVGDGFTTGITLFSGTRPAQTAGYYTFGTEQLLFPSANFATDVPFTLSFWWNHAPFAGTPTNNDFFLLLWASAFRFAIHSPDKSYNMIEINNGTANYKSVFKMTGVSSGSWNHFVFSHVVGGVDMLYINGIERPYYSRSRVTTSMVMGSPVYMNYNAAINQQTPGPHLIKDFAVLSYAVQSQKEAFILMGRSLPNFRTATITSPLTSINNSLQVSGLANISGSLTSASIQLQSGGSIIKDGWDLTALTAYVAASVNVSSVAAGGVATLTFSDSRLVSNTSTSISIPAGYGLATVYATSGITAASPFQLMLNSSYLSSYGNAISIGGWMMYTPIQVAGGEVITVKNTSGSAATPLAGEKLMIYLSR